MSAHRIEIDDLLGLRHQAAALDLSSQRRVRGDRSGGYHSSLRGRGMEFEEHRVYQSGDEVRTIDWRVTARTGVPHVRLYREERERPVMLVTDFRAPMWFGTRGCFKAVLAARAAALCAWAALDNGDRVGGLGFGAQTHFEFRPASGHRAALRWMDAMSRYQADADVAQSGFATMLQKLLRAARVGSLVVLFSDFRELNHAEIDLLKRLAQRVELILGFIYDPLEAALPPPGRYPVSRDGQAAPIVFDSAVGALRTGWADGFELRRQSLIKLSRDLRAHWLELNTAVPAVESLSAVLGRAATQR